MKLSLAFTLCLCLGCTSGRTIDSIIASASSLGTYKSGVKQDTPGAAVLTELDILLTPDQYNALYGKHNTAHANSSTTSARETREAPRHLYKRWPNKRVPYRIEADQFSSRDQEEIKAAIDHWERYTCIAFPLATDADLFSLNFENSVDCSSFIGMVWWAQSLYLAPVCRHKHLIIHEIGHAVGFIHEHSRTDRDDYVTIKEENITPNSKTNFAKNYLSEATSFGVPYDYRSIMHYGGTAYSRNGELTIVTKDPAFQEVIGNQETLSFNDIKLANLMYNCNEHCSFPITCPKEGFLGKDCQCWCPGDPVKECEENIATESPPVKPTLKPTEGPIETTPCRDLDRFCFLWVIQDYCLDNNYAKNHCKASCSLCEDDIVTERPKVKTTLKPTEGPTTRNTAKPTEGPTTRQTTRPTAKPTEGPTTRQTAKPTEGPVETTPCRDLDRFCFLWVKHDYCRDNNYAKNHCKASCSLCEDDIVTERPRVKTTLKPTEGPTTRQTTRPTTRNTAKPTEGPTTRPTTRPTEKPTEGPTTRPTTRPTEKPTEGPTTRPTEKPTEGPTTRPTTKPTEKPTEGPTTRPTTKPTEKPTEGSTTKPTERPIETTPCRDLDRFCFLWVIQDYCRHNNYAKTHCKASCFLCEDDIVTERPRVKTTEGPTTRQTTRPTSKPTEGPTTRPKTRPTAKPTKGPTTRPTTRQTAKPTERPTTRPTEGPTTRPTEGPTTRPTEGPTTRPTEGPTTRPTERPTTRHTEGPTTRPTEGPTTRPTEGPTTRPTEGPTTRPTERPPTRPTEGPTTRPTEGPTTRPTEGPTTRSTEGPTTRPTEGPTTRPTERPKTRPTERPTTRPTEGPTKRPTEVPTTRPTEGNTTRSTEGPTTRPTEGSTTRSTEGPTTRPTTRPTDRPTTRPTERPTTRPTEGTATRPTCTDTDHLCPIWAKENYCKNSEYMQTHCKASCSLCEGDIVTERPPVKPTEGPTTRQTDERTMKPIQGPMKPTEKLTRPTEGPTRRPTEGPTARPKERPTTRPTERPTTRPTEGPTTRPRMRPIVTTDCRDLDQDCRYLAMLGQCKINDYVETHCRASCFACVGGVFFM